VLTDYSELAREKMWARIYLIPALQAEEDRDQVRRYLADKAREKELLGTETRVYNSDRCVLGDAVAGRRVANHAIIGSFDLHLRSHRNTRQSRSDILHWACIYKCRNGGVLKPSLAIPCGIAITESRTSFAFVTVTRMREIVPSMIFLSSLRSHDAIDYDTSATADTRRYDDSPLAY
jgi:hypothetical protein